MFTFIVILILLNTLNLSVANAAEEEKAIKIEKEIHINGKAIQKVFADKNTNQIYYIEKNFNNWEEIVALNMEGKELWRYKPTRYLDYDLELLGNGNIAIRAHYASKIYTDGFNIGGSKVAMLTSNGEVQWEVDSDKVIKKIRIDENEIILAYNSNDVYIVNKNNKLLDTIYSGINKGTTNYKRIQDANFYNGFVRIMVDGSDGYELVDVDLNGETIKTSNIANFHLIDNAIISPFGEIILNVRFQGAVVIDEHANILAQTRSLGSLDNYIFDNNGIMMHFKNTNNKFDDFIYYDMINKSISKFSYSKLDSNSKLLELNNGIVIDQNKNVFLTIKNKLLILNSSGDKLATYENKTTSNIYVGSKLDENRLILYTDTSLYIVNMSLKESTNEWLIWAEKEKVDINKNWTISFTQPVNPKNIKDYIYVAFDEKGNNIINVKKEISPDGKSIIISPYGSWLSNTEYFLFISEDIESIYNQRLNQNIRMKFDTY
ncbi:Ig-like domain-containing protein [Lysinibacillus boronitolerans]|uniref:Ig-like domain-containing protein n=1 Tax=Lysinibacillus boronitolerans TaxID=309788 RepID=UPI0021619FD0|nr:Ig-like domain-containing protein [Lysinibacillus boronitolerans]MCS1394449.1 Ig-like domain-containing protein [Lysinibacillus boronitolerans]